MALFTHWEWRGFGDVSNRFRERFETLRPAFAGEPDGQQIIDEYLWIPNIDVNLKFRRGTATQDGLKIKRLNETRGALEKWTESPDEIFPFPLSRHAWRSLRKDLKIPADRHFDPPAEAGREEAVRFLLSVEPRTRSVVVQKLRRTALWGEAGTVKVELAEILTPSKTVSVGLEIWEPSNRRHDEQSVALLAQALSELELRQETLETMNYLGYIRRCVE